MSPLVTLVDHLVDHSAPTSLRRVGVIRPDASSSAVCSGRSMGALTPRLDCQPMMTHRRSAPEVFGMAVCCHATNAQSMFAIEHCRAGLGPFVLEMDAYQGWTMFDNGVTYLPDAR